MKSKEVVPRPTGRFPSVEAERRQRFEFIGQNNLLLRSIKERVNLAEIRRVDVAYPVTYWPSTTASTSTTL